MPRWILPYLEENIETFSIRPDGDPAAVIWLTQRRGALDPCHPVGKLSLTNVSNRGSWIFLMDEIQRQRWHSESKIVTGVKKVFFPFLNVWTKKYVSDHVIDKWSACPNAHFSCKHASIKKEDAFVMPLVIRLQKAPGLFEASIYKQALFYIKEIVNRCSRQW